MDYSIPMYGVVCPVHRHKAQVATACTVPAPVTPPTEVLSETIPYLLSSIQAYNVGSTEVPAHHPPMARVPHLLQGRFHYLGGARASWPDLWNPFTENTANTANAFVIGTPICQGGSQGEQCAVFVACQRRQVYVTSGEL